MAQVTIMTARLACSMGVAPSALQVPPANRVRCSGQPAANILDSKPLVNIQPFGACMSPANPAVAAATAAAVGVLTPMPCVPVTPGPWAPGSPTVRLGAAPLLDSTSTCACAWAGLIRITDAGQDHTSVD